LSRVSCDGIRWVNEGGGDVSGIIGHTMYAVLGAKAAAQRGLPIAGVLGRHTASYLAGAYLGCDVQTMPEAVCVDTGQGVGYGTARLEKSPLTGGAVRPFVLRCDGEEYTPYEIHERFYGRAHLVFGWGKAEREQTVPWDHLAEYCVAVAEDAMELFGPGQRQLAYVFGWMTHLVGDCLIKSIQPGLDLQLLGGTYTAKNRPIQDLVTFHEIGRQELGLDWAALLADSAETPVEPIQLHYMRVGETRGRLARKYTTGWIPGDGDLLRAVLAENRRYLRIYQARVIERLQLVQTPDGPECSEALREATGGLSYAEMVEAAGRSRFRRALWQIGEAIADLFEQVFEVAKISSEGSPLNGLAAATGPSWAELRERWLVD
jgi:hypothetical protein